MIIAGLSYIGPKIAPDYRPRITATVKPTILQIYNDDNDKLIMRMKFKI